MSTPQSIFISYAHIDNEVLGSGQEGWITSLHKALEVRLAQLMGRRPRIWRDQKLQGNDFFGDEIVDQFPEVAALISIISPRYLTSEWCIRELQTFCKVAEQTGGLRLGNKARIFKLIKTQIPFEKHPPEVADLLGYEFFRVDAQTGRARELSQHATPDLERLYWARLDDLAYDIAQLLESIETLAPVPSRQAVGATVAAAAPQLTGNEKTVFLADTSHDLREQRNSVKRDLLQHGHMVLPDQQPPLFFEDLAEVVKRDLSRSNLSVHMVGQYYGIIPEGATTSIVAIENELAGKRELTDGFERLIWIPPAIEVEDERQRGFHQFLQTEEAAQGGTDILETPLEEFKAIVHEKLEPKPKPGPEPASEEDALVRIYLICDLNDLDEVAPLEDYLYDQGYEVILPVFDGDEAQVRLDHQENLKMCAAVIIYYGRANELWLRAKLRELQKIAGYGRKEPMRAKAIYAGPPGDRRKDRLRSREALVIKGPEGFSAELLKDFLMKLEEGGPT